MKTKKRIVNERTDSDLPCEICGKRFKTAQGLYGHKHWVHGSGAPEGPLPVVPVASPGGSGDEGPPPSAPTSSKELKAEVESLRLQLQRRKLQAEFPSAPAPRSDVMQESGLGEIDAEVRQQAQRRAFALPDQAASRSSGIDWLSLLNSPNLPAILQLLRGGLGGSDSGTGGLGVLKELGIDLKDLLSQASAPKAGSMNIAGLDFTGASLTPELLKSVLEFKATEERTKSEFDGRKAMADGLEHLVELLAPHLEGLFGANGPSPGRAAGIAGAGPGIREPRRLGIECERCGTLNEVPVDQPVGGVIHCQGKVDGEPCTASWVATEPAPAEERKRRPIEKVQVPEPAKSVACENCGQLLNIEGKALGSECICPICKTAMVLMSPDTPLETDEPLTPEQKAIEGFNRSRLPGGFGDGA